MSERIGDGDNNAGGENPWDNLAKMDGGQAEGIGKTEVVTNEMVNEAYKQLTAEEKGLMSKKGYTSPEGAYAHIQEILASRGTDEVAPDYSKDDSYIT